MPKTTGLCISLEISGKCQLRCEHCSADSSPEGSHGAMTRSDWTQVIDDCATIEAAVVQFIGGEPTLHPDLPALIARAHQHGLPVEVFSNLVHVPPTLWQSFADGVTLATSYYSDDPTEQEAITNGRRGTALRTRNTIAEVVQRRIPLRVEIIRVRDDQRVDQARDQLLELGVPADQIHVDDLHAVGRAQLGEQPDAAELCGNCALGRLAVSPDGDVWPCVFARWHVIGNVRAMPLTALVASMALDDARDALGLGAPSPRACSPMACGPDNGGCAPANACPPDNIGGPGRTDIPVAIGGRR